MTKNIRVVDEQGTDYGATYPKRAKGLVKNGRARFIDDNTLCLACPPDKINLEDTMNKNNNADNAAINNEINEKINAEINERIDDELNEDLSYLEQELMDDLDELDSLSSPETQNAIAEARAAIEQIAEELEQTAAAQVSDELKAALKGYAQRARSKGERMRGHSERMQAHSERMQAHAERMRAHSERMRDRAQAGRPTRPTRPTRGVTIGQAETIGANINAPTASFSDAISTNDILARIDKIIGDSQYIKDIGISISNIPNHGAGDMGSPGDIAGQAKANALGDTVKCREATNQQALRFLEKMYDDMNKQSNPTNDIFAGINKILNDTQYVKDIYESVESIEFDSNEDAIASAMDTVRGTVVQRESTNKQALALLEKMYNDSKKQSNSIGDIFAGIAKVQNNLKNQN